MFPFAIAFVASACGRDKTPAAVADHPRSVSEKRADGESRWGPWSTPVNLGQVVNSTFNDRHPAISPNGLSLYITSDRPGGFGPKGTFNIWVSQRARVHDPWGPPRNLGPNINNPLGFAPNISPDGHWLFFAGGQLCGGGSPGNIWVSHREDTDDDFAWEPAVDLGPEINDPRCDSNAPTFFRDEETGITRIYLTGQHRVGLGDFDIFVSTQREDDVDRGFIGTFGPAVLVPELSSPRRDTRTAISLDGLEMFITSNRAGSVPDSSGQPFARPLGLDAGKYAQSLVHARELGSHGQHARCRRRSRTIVRWHDALLLFDPPRRCWRRGSLCDDTHEAR